MDEPPPTQILPSPPPMVEVELPTLINTATRQQHTELNRLIIERLPFALPPNASNPATFGHGLMVFARIYIKFEELWRESTVPTRKRDQMVGPKHYQLLMDLYLKPLCRVEKLLLDLNHISMATGDDKVAHILKREQQPILDAMERSIRAKPHTLIAYAWVMYMAIFSGGRWIRAQLLNAGPEFWSGEFKSDTFKACGEPAAGFPGFSFLCFNGDGDGEDIKKTFKLRLKAAESLLTPEEKADVVAAAKTLFDDCITLVGMLDVDMRQRKVAPQTQRTAKSDIDSPGAVNQRGDISQALCVGGLMICFLAGYVCCYLRQW